MKNLIRKITNRKITYIESNGNTYISNMYRICNTFARSGRLHNLCFVLFKVSATAYAITDELEPTNFGNQQCFKAKSIS